MCIYKVLGISYVIVVDLTATLPLKLQNVFFIFFILGAEYVKVTCIPTHTE